MTTLVYLLTAFAVTLGVGVVIWSFLDTRKKYYAEYKGRKGK